MKKRFILALILVLAMFSMCSCYFNARIKSSEVGIRMDDGVSVSDVVGAGRYTNLGFYSDIESMDTSAKKVVFQIADVSTSDKQTVGVEVLAEVARKSDEESVRLLWKNYNAAAKDDGQLASLVQDLIYSPVNKVSVQMTVDEMLGVAEDSDKSRATMESEVFRILSPLLAERGIALNIFQIKNISVDPQYQAKLQEKSTAAIESELAEQKAQQLQKQLVQEEAQTRIELEKAKRANQVAEEQAKIYETSKEAYELKRLELLKDMLGESDKVYFIPEGTDITLFLGNQIDTPVPVQ